MVPDGKKEDAGVAIGAAAADEMIASRADDGRGDPQYVYTKTAALGVWPAAAVPGGMALPWLGFVDPVVDVDAGRARRARPVYSSAAFATDYEEARTLGPIDRDDPDRDQTAIAVFFSANPMPMYRNALCDVLDAEPLGLLPTTRLFARIDAAIATTFIETWRLKYEVGFWRPDQAVAARCDRRQRRHQPAPGDWVPLVTNPAYSDYTSGHAAATSPFAEVLRQTLGDDTPLVLKGAATSSAVRHLERARARRAARPDLGRAALP